MADEEDFDLDLDETFLSATNYVRRCANSMASDHLLYFYGRYKQATEGKCNTPKPGFFDFQGKAKWDAWNKLGSMDKLEAMKQYVTQLTNIDHDWRNKLSASGDDSGKKKAATSGMGVTVSVMARTESDMSDGEKTVFDWCKEGNVEKVREILGSNSSIVDGLDEEGLALLHWASDRGYTQMVELLLNLHADINIQDVDKQTALHYAVSCEHPDIIKLLIKYGIDTSLKDADGNTVMDIARDAKPDIKLLLEASA
ncbi:acyl-CoA-binding domain-containing protein 6-like [Physella acuta]|uniref:acyl-CoA-binding domain-containing protein 6-like n=1 Tax=Physella acuta TaxID=109671 RepID=UPI0027DC680E|nr:acyl-CoA-binding domain-containing protein 6-like [Physella acuta]